jgi:anaerobic ribonucleoside-triphosphate reductase activating protein
MKIRLAHPIQSDSIVDGEGIRTVIWTQGCTHNCLGCHNPETHSFKAGFLMELDDLKQQIKNLNIQDGITLSGGDPFAQVDACLELTSFCKKIGLNVWCYTGYTFEQLMIMSNSNRNIIELLKNIDVLVDGKFILAEKSLNLKFKGSRNQRIIDVKKSLKNQRAILIKKYKTEKKYTSLASQEKYLFV